MSPLTSIWTKTVQLVDLASKLTIIGVPILYFTGWIYLETYWKQFGISETLFNPSVTDYLRSGAMVLILSIVRGVSSVLVFACIILVVIVLLAFIRMKAIPMVSVVHRRIRIYLRSLRKENRRRDLPKHRQLVSRMEFLLDTLASMGMAILITFLLLIGLIFVGIQPSKALAEEQAAKSLARLDSLTASEENWVLAREKGSSHVLGVVLQCGSDLCALYSEGRTVMIPREAIASMETCRRVLRSQGALSCLRAVPGPAGGIEQNARKPG